MGMNCISVTVASFIENENNNIQTEYTQPHKREMIGTCLEITLSMDIAMIVVPSIIPKEKRVR